MFGKQQFIGKVEGPLTDRYQMMKVIYFINIRKSEVEVMEEYTE